MTLYRLVDPPWAEQPHLLNGVGAALTGQRWNRPGDPTLYLADNLEVVVAEKGYYAIQLAVEEHHKNTKQRGLLQKKLHKVELHLATMDVMDSLSLTDISTDAGLAAALKLASMNAHSVQDSRTSPYFRLPGRWTQYLGQFLAKQTTSQGMIAKSARSERGNCHVLFPPKLKSYDIGNVKTETVELSAIDADGKRFKKGAQPQLGKVMLHRSGSSQTYDVLNFKL